MSYIPHSKKEITDMLAVIGVKKIEDLFLDIPKDLIRKDLFCLPEKLSEQEVSYLMEEISTKNKKYINFLGAGSYCHFIPSAVKHLVSRSEFYTSYTPYQPEISQGILQAIFEYQTVIASLTGMDLANASLYDGASSLGEAVIMSSAITQRKEILISRALHPDYRETVKTYANAKKLNVVEMKFGSDGKTDMQDFIEKINDNTACVLIGSPNFFGVIENIKEFSAVSRGAGIITVQSISEPLSLGILSSPGEMGADIACGEGQSFGTPVNFGGPSLGFMAVLQKYMRHMPGRIVGESQDIDGKRAYILTLQAREQHIRRERATSNICSNEALIALTALIYLTVMGQKLKDLAELNLKRANIVLKRMEETGKCRRKFLSPFFNEFVVKIPNLDRFYNRCIENNIQPGLKLSSFYPNMKDCLLVCVTETVKEKNVEKMLNLL